MNGQTMIVKRTGEVVEFHSDKIKEAILKATRKVNAKLKEQQVDAIVDKINEEISDRFTDFFPNVENVQDIVEKHLVKEGLYEVAKEYILYRAKRQTERDEETKETLEKAQLGKLTVKKRDGRTVLFDVERLKSTILRAAKGYENVISVDLIAKEALKNIHDGITTADIEKALVLAAIAFIEKDTSYSFVSSRLFLQRMYKEVMDRSVTTEDMESWYRESFIEGVKKGVDLNLLDKRMLDFDLVQLAQNLVIERDELFQYIGIQTLYERYFLKKDEQRIELPQAFWMRVAMGLALEEGEKTEKALEFYNLISSLRYVPSTPTLFHAGTAHPQLSSCYLTTVEDDLDHIFKCLRDNAFLSKWSGGLGNDWTNIRSTGALIKSTQVDSQGVVPFLKIANDVTAAINRSGKRRGATCAYLETWHLDIEDFLDLRKNTGDERRRTHDMNTSNWIPDLFMKRVMSDEPWTLFSPDETPELHHTYGKRFEKKYEEYEQKTKTGEIKKFKVIPATKLWRKMISMLFETGHPWITFKDPCNIRSPQDHAGVVHSSNLCTEITLNTSAEETAVCNLGSVNLPRHMKEGKIDEDMLQQTIKTAMRMLDNVVDLNFYPTIEAKNSNKKHRPVGLGVMGYQDALFMLDIPFDSPAAFEFTDTMMEMISYYAILGSSEVAKEKGTYESYKGSKWDRGIFPVDTIELLQQERGVPIEVNKEERLDWSKVRAHVKEFGMRNSNCMAIAPTATIANISGVFPCIEPIYKNIYVKANISGEFTVVNDYLIEDLKKAHVWNQEMLEQLKYYDGDCSLIANIPDNLKEKYKDAFSISPSTVVKHASLRSKWIDQSQSTNIFFKGSSGAELSDIYINAWKSGLKTTYYLRTLAASQIEKSTLDAKKYGFTQKREYKEENGSKNGAAPVAPAVAAAANGVTAEGVKLCKVEDPDCEACQ